MSHVQFVHEICSLHRVLNEENGNVVSNNVPVALIRVELDSKAAHIAHSICRSTATQHGRESQEYRRRAGSVSEDASRSDVHGGLEEGELSKGAGTTGVDNALGDSLVVEAVDLDKSVTCHYCVEHNRHLLAGKVVLK